MHELRNQHVFGKFLSIVRVKQLLCFVHGVRLNRRKNRLCKRA